MTSQQQTQTQAGNGISFVGLLTITLVILKALGYIHWGWVWVFAPLWISWGVFISFLLIVGLVFLIGFIYDEVQRSKRKKAKAARVGSTTRTRG